MPQFLQWMHVRKRVYVKFDFLFPFVTVNLTYF